MSDRLHFVSPLERAVFLRGLEQLQGATPEQIAAVAHSAEERFFRKGQELLDPTRPPASIHIIVNGSVRAEGDEHRGALLGPGDTMGTLTVLSRAERGFRAVAETDVTTLEVGIEDIFELYEDRFDVFVSTLRGLSRELLRLRKQIRHGTRLAPRDGLVLPPRELDLVERLVHMGLMGRGGIFQRTSMDALVRMARRLHEVRFDAGTVLWRTGDPSGYMLIIMEGEVSCRLPEGRIFYAGDGYPLGNLENHAAQPRWYEATALKPLRALHADTEPFYDILEDHFDLSLDFLSAVAGSVLRVARENAEAGVPVETTKRPGETGADDADAEGSPEDHTGSKPIPEDHAAIDDSAR